MVHENFQIQKRERIIIRDKSKSHYNGKQTHKYNFKNHSSKKKTIKNY